MTCMYKHREDEESDVSEEEETELEEESSSKVDTEEVDKYIQAYCDDFFDGFEDFSWSRGEPDPHWTLDPTVADSPASVHSPHRKRRARSHELCAIELIVESGG